MNENKKKNSQKTIAATTPTTTSTSTLFWNWKRKQQHQRQNVFLLTTSCKLCFEDFSLTLSFSVLFPTGFIIFTFFSENIYCKWRIFFLSLVFITSNWVEYSAFVRNVYFNFKLLLFVLPVTLPCFFFCNFSFFFFAMAVEIFMPLLAFHFVHFV